MRLRRTAAALLALALAAPAAAQRAPTGLVVPPSLREQMRRDLRAEPERERDANSIPDDVEIHARPDLDGDGIPEIILIDPRRAEGPGNHLWWVYRRTPGGYRRLHADVGYQLEPREERTDGWRHLAGAVRLLSQPVAYEDIWAFDGREYAWIGMDRLEWDTRIDTLHSTTRLRSPLPERAGQPRTLTLNPVPTGFPGLSVAAAHTTCPAPRARRSFPCGRPRLLLSWTGEGRPPWGSDDRPCIILRVRTFQATMEPFGPPVCAEGNAEGPTMTFRPNVRQWNEIVSVPWIEIGFRERVVPISDLAKEALFYFLRRAELLEEGRN